MNTGTLLRLLIAAPLGLVMASCASTSEPSRTSGRSLDNPPPARFGSIPDAPGDVSPSPSTDPNAIPPIEDDVPVTGSTTPPSPSSDDSTVGSTTTSPPAPDAPKPAAETPVYGKMVPGRSGFVYPPGVEQKPENMVDVRDFSPGQKVRDPRTGKIFLVP